MQQKLQIPNEWMQFILAQINAYPGITDLAITRHGSVWALGKDLRKPIVNVPREIAGRAMFDELVQPLREIRDRKTRMGLVDDPFGLVPIEESIVTPNRILLRASLARIEGHAEDDYELVLRIQPAKIPKPEDMTIPENVADALQEGIERGMVLLCGTTGSGKSTTVATCLQHYMQRKSTRLITLEDPIEYRFQDSRTSHARQRQLGEHFRTFSEGLAASLRQKPDLIMVQELRDALTANTAINAALSGHGVISTLHAGTPSGAFQRLAAMLKDIQLSPNLLDLSTSVQTIICQRLASQPNTGKYIPIFEVYRSTVAGRAAIRKGEFARIDQIIETGQEEGMYNFAASLEERIREGLLPPELAN